MRFSSYSAFKSFVWDEYRAIPEELTEPNLGFAPDTHWARRMAPRFYRGLKAIEPYVNPGASLLDVASYPCSFVRLVRAAFGESLELSACGMPVSDNLKANIAPDRIEFRPCNLDPDVVSPLQLPTGLPFGDNSIDIITCMEVVEHLYSLKTLITECARVLRPEGHLYITTDNILRSEGLITIFKESDTNLDHDLDQTSIWSDHSNQWRGHVRFYSIRQLREAGARAGLNFVCSDYFEHYEDPDVVVWPERHVGSGIRRMLRGNGSRPPIRLRSAIKGLYHLGFRSMSSRFSNHIELILAKASS